MSWFDISIASVTVLIGSTLQGSVGFGMGLLASPVLILIEPRFVPAPILLSTFCLTSFLAVREWDAIDVDGLRWAVVGRTGGTILAGFVLAVLPNDWMMMVLGLLVLFGVAMSMSGLKVKPTRLVLLWAGALSGVMGTIASIGGPPIALVYQDAPGARIRATMSCLVWVGTIMSLIVLWLVGRFGETELRLTLILLPGLFLGVFVSRWTAHVVDRGSTRAAVLSVAGLAGFVVVLRQLV